MMLSREENCLTVQLSFNTEANRIIHVVECVQLHPENFALFQCEMQ